MVENQKTQSCLCIEPLITLISMNTHPIAYQFSEFVISLRTSFEGIWGKSKISLELFNGLFLSILEEIHIYTCI